MQEWPLPMIRVRLGKADESGKTPPNWEGFPPSKDHEFTLVSLYENAPDEPQDAVGGHVRLQGRQELRGEAPSERAHSAGRRR